MFQTETIRKSRFGGKWQTFHFCIVCLHYNENFPCFLIHFFHVSKVISSIFTEWKLNSNFVLATTSLIIFLVSEKDESFWMLFLWFCSLVLSSAAESTPTKSTFSSTASRTHHSMRAVGCCRLASDQHESFNKKRNSLFLPKCWFCVSFL